MPEGLLRKYRPVGPSQALRERVIQDPRSAWPWAVAAAALLALTVGLHLATASLAGNVFEAPAAPFGVDARKAHVAALLGGGEKAQRLATLIVMEEETHLALPPVAGASSPARDLR